METFLIYLALGAFAGLIAGLFGVGGGVVIVPVLIMLFHAAGMSEGVIAHLAIGTSLATIAVTSVSAMLAHHRRGAVRWNIFRQLGPAVMVGALVGAAIADMLPTSMLRAVFGVFEILVAIQIGFNLNAAPTRALPRAPALFGAGSIIGALSSIVGIGGGTMMVPFFTWHNVPVRQAVATSSACGLPIAIAGALGFMWVGWGDARLPANSTGYLYWPALIGIAASSLAFAPVGARLVHALPAMILRRILAIFLAILGALMLTG